MSDQIKQSLVDEFLSERLSQYERHFQSVLWKKSFQPYLKALYEMAVRSALQGKDHMTIDMKRGEALAFENILNLPKFIDFLIEQKTKGSEKVPERKLSGAITDYEGDFSDLKFEE
jgi:hypothetical protein